MSKILLENFLDEESLEKVKTRDGGGKAIAELGSEHEDVFCISADVAGSARAKYFMQEHPERFVQCGVAEQNMAGVAAGLAYQDKVPYMVAYAAFLTGRNWEPIRTTIAYPNHKVRLMSSHAGIATGPDGATHQMTEDIGIMRALPNFTVISPADANQARQAILASYSVDGPVYVRTYRPATPVFTKKDAPFEIGKAQVLKEGNDLTIVGVGYPAYNALKAAHEIEDYDIEVINLHTVKPIDVDTLVKSAEKTGKVVTVEDHQVETGMGSAVAEVLSEHHPVPVKRHGIYDRFGESGSPAKLIKHFGLDAEGIKEQVLEFLS